MALAPYPLNFHTPCYRSRQSYIYRHESRYPFLNTRFANLKLKSSSSRNTSNQLDDEQATPVRVAGDTLKKKNKKKARPSFFDDICHRWSNKVGSTRDRLPWQDNEDEFERWKQHLSGDDEDGKEEEEEKDKRNEAKDSLSSGFGISGEEKNTKPHSEINGASSFSLQHRIASAPWAHGTNFRFSDVAHSNSSNEEAIDGSCGAFNSDNFADGDKYKDSDTDGVIETIKAEHFPGAAVPGRGMPVWRRKNTRLAEKTIPAHELSRLRKVALRMLEKFKVGSSGITQALIEAIHEKWQLDEVVKLKFEEPLSLNMNRAHDTLESRTGGLVIWRSGSSIVLYRGMSYNLPCVQNFAKQIQADKAMVKEFEDFSSKMLQDVELKSSVKTKGLSAPDFSKYPKGLSDQELTDLTEFNYDLDEIGPRFTDWPGCQPFPVDADQLPPLVPGYKTPYRLLPHGLKACLNNKEMTYYRRLARRMPPHFALGRNRDLQGLAKAMVKLWEKNALAKIAIKRGVLNTRNERMAEELKRLTGGTLLSRNKDYIVFYRGNDFLPPSVAEVLTERQKMAKFQQDEEDKARETAAANVTRTKSCKTQLVAGTLTETIAATSRWAPEPDSVDVEEMKREVVTAKRASSIKNLEHRLDFAKRKLRKAELALAKVQKDLEPAALPSDLEVISNEERFLYRKIGLSMKPYLLVGKREVYDGIIENMHLHWKHRELVKLVVRGKNITQVKHIAVSLEAESGGLLVSVDRTTKGYAIIVYRGKNYKFPEELRPKNLLTRKQALVRSIELQRREALKHHITKLQESIESLKFNQVLHGDRKNVEDGRLCLRTDNFDVSCNNK